MKEPLFLNTLDEAAAWLAWATGHEWTPKEVLNAVLATYGAKPRKLLSDKTWFPKEIKIKLLAAPPLDTKFGWYKHTLGSGFVLKHNMGHEMMPLYMMHVGQLLAIGETDVAMARNMGESGCDKDEFVSVIGAPVRVELSMVRIKGDELQRLRSTLPDMLKEREQDPAHAATKKEDAEPPQADESRNVSGSPSWVLKKPERVHVLTGIIYDILKVAYDAGQKCPTARDVIDELRKNPPPDIVEVGRDEIKYLNDKRGTDTADLDAIRKRIERMTSPLNGR